MASLEESVEKWQSLAEDSSKVLGSREDEYKITVEHFEGRLHVVLHAIL